MKYLTSRFLLIPVLAMVLTVSAPAVGTALACSELRQKLSRSGCRGVDGDWRGQGLPRGRANAGPQFHQLLRKSLLGIRTFAMPEVSASAGPREGFSSSITKRSANMAP